jgi:hypothetical protein
VSHVRARDVAIVAARSLFRLRPLGATLNGAERSASSAWKWRPVRVRPELCYKGTRPPTAAI